MLWILPEALVGSRNSPSDFRRNLHTNIRRRWPESSAFGYSAAVRLFQEAESIGVPDDHGHFQDRLSPVRHS
jgi:hypothetical protein